MPSRSLDDGRGARRIAAFGACLAALLGALGAIVLVEDPRAGPCPPRADGRDGRRPNVVVVMTDDQDARSVGVMRHVKRRLKREGTTFRNFFATFPLCCPSRATFLTGQYPHNHGVLSNTPPEGGYERLDSGGTLPESLQCAGYRTAYVGKFLNGYGRRGNDPNEVPPGWTRWFVNVKGGYFDYVMNDDGRLRRYGTDADDYRTDVEGRKAARFIRRSAGRSDPFFLVFATQAPHTESGGGRPLRPAPRHERRFENERLPRPRSFNERDVSDKPAFVRGRSEKKPRRIRTEYRDRLRSLLAVDEAVKRIDRTLRDVGERRETLVIFTSDNGYFLGEHRLKGKTKSGALYDEAVRVPFIMRGLNVPRNAVRREIAGNVDLAPTILDVTGTEPGRRPDGVSLMEVVQGARGAGRRDLLLEDLESKGVRTRDFMYAEHPGGTTELYDLRDDRLQLRSRHANPRYRAVHDRLAKRLRELDDCVGAECL